MNKLSFYNKTSIIVFSILLTGVGGALLMGYNLRKVGKNNVVVPLVLIALLAYAVLRQLVKRIFPGSLYEAFVPSIIMGFILAFPVWNRYLGEFTSYDNKKPWIPLIVVVVLWGLMMVNFLHLMQ